VGDQGTGITFKAKIDVLESMGSEFYAYFVVDADKVSSRELEELASDAGAADLPHQEGSQITARLEPASKVRQGEETELWFNTEHIHLFDPESGQALLGSNGGATSDAPAPAPTSS
jgi:multiple sugar transport system ATP-binding protein